MLDRRDQIRRFVGGELEQRIGSSRGFGFIDDLKGLSVLFEDEMIGRNRENVDGPRAHRHFRLRHEADRVSHFRPPENLAKADF